MTGMTAFPFTSRMTYDESGWPILDRAVDSTVLRKLAKNYYTDGVFGIADSRCLQVKAPADGTSTVLVCPGVAHIRGATGYTDEIESLDLPEADENFPRYDTVVVRINDNSDFRNMYLDIIVGTPSNSPTVPELTRTGSVWEIGLADLYRPANSSTITDSYISDTRQKSSRCGYVTAINKLDTDSLMQQLEAFYREFVEKSMASFGEFMQRNTDDYNRLVEYIAELTSMSKEKYEIYLADLREFYRDIRSKGQQDYDDFNAEISAYIDDLETRGDSSLAAIIQQLIDFRNSKEAYFMELLEIIRGQLETDPAGHLQNEIDSLRSQLEDVTEMLYSGRVDAELIADTGDNIVDDMGNEILVGWPICGCNKD